MKDVDLDDLEAKARAATAGPWKWDESTHLFYGANGDTPIYGHFHVGLVVDAADRDFVCTANPQTVLELVERLRARRTDESVEMKLATENETLRAALAEALDKWESRAHDDEDWRIESRRELERIAELRKLVSP